MHAADEHLLSSIAAGDQAAFAMLYDRFAPRAYGLIVKLIGRRPDAEDVLQEVFADVWRRSSLYNPALGSAETWILMIARSRAIDRLRKLRREQQRLGALSALAPELAASSPPELPHESLAPAIERLEPELREVVHMAYTHGLTRDDIAATLNIPVGTVKTRLRTAVTLLAASAHTHTLPPRRPAP